jgi:putative DNA primase/helicase
MPHDPLLAQKKIISAAAELAGLRIVEPDSPPSANSDRVVDASLECVMASEIEPENIVYLWENRIPLGKETVFCGVPDVGKSTVAVDVASRGTTGRDWPDCKNIHEPFDVLMLVAEDDLADTVVPRLMAAGADLKRIHFALRILLSDKSKTAERRIALNTDLSAIEDMLRKNPCIKLVIIDPFGSYLGTNKKNNEEEMRTMLVATKEVAERCNVAIVVIDHFNKNYQQSAIHRQSGAGALTAVPRASWAFVKDADDPEKLTRLMLNIKLNVVSERKKTGLRYRFKETPVTIKNIITTLPTIEWLGASVGDIDETLQSQQSDPRQNRSAKAQRFLRKFLADGPRPSEEIQKTAGKSQISRGALWEAKTEMDIRATKVSGRWWWELPAQGKQ